MSNSDVGISSVQDEQAGAWRGERPQGDPFPLAVLCDACGGVTLYSEPIELGDDDAWCEGCQAVWIEWLGTVEVDGQLCLD